MAGSDKHGDLHQILKPLYQRASEAEDRLSKLETLLANKKDVGNEESLKIISDLQSKLEEAKANQLLEREKAQKLAAENAKLEYRIIHLINALKEADCKLESK